MHLSDKVALVTGADGFTGKYLCSQLLNQGCRLVCLSRETGSEFPGAENHAVELADRQAVAAIMKETAPAYIFHLAAVSFVAHEDAADFYKTNVIGTENIISAATGIGSVEKMLIASSANVYGNPESEGPLDEATPLAPVNHYGCSKLSMEHIAKTYFDDIPIVITRPFNYTGVGQNKNFLIPKIVDHYRRSAKSIELGNIDVWRDFSDVRDVVQDYIDLACSPVAGEVVNICSGRGYSIRECIDMLSGLSGYEIEIQVNPAFVRATDIRKLVGSNDKLRSLTGRQERIDFADTLKWMLSDA